mgnify:CR=1 FL=1
MDLSFRRLYLGHVSDEASLQRLGVVLFAIYFLQLGIGAFIHFVKPEQPRKRPAQNYFHAIFGLLIIGLALAQVRIGFNREWTRATGRTEVPNGINIVWWIWVVVRRLLSMLSAASARC